MSNKETDLREELATAVRRRDRARQKAREAQLVRERHEDEAEIYDEQVRKISAELGNMTTPDAADTPVILATN